MAATEQPGTPGSEAKPAVTQEMIQALRRIHASDARSTWLYGQAHEARRQFGRSRRRCADAAADKARAAVVAEDDARIVTERVSFPGPSGKPISGCSRSRRTRPARLPPVLVIHENRGLNPHIEDVTRRFAGTAS